MAMKAWTSKKRRGSGVSPAVRPSLDSVSSFCCALNALPLCISFGSAGSYKPLREL